MKNSYCDQATSFSIPDDLICIESINLNPAHCEFESLLTIYRPCDSRPILIGILAFIPSNCESGKPFGCTRYANFLDWIQDIKAATNSHLTNKQKLFPKIYVLFTVLIFFTELIKRDVITS